MLNVLLESRSHRGRQRGGAVVSVAVHGGLMLLAVLTTGTVAPPGPNRTAERTIPIYPPLPEETRRAPTPSIATKRGEEVPLPAPPTPIVPDIDSDQIPPVDLDRTTPIVDDWRPRSSIGSPTFGRPRAGGVGGGEDGIPFAGGVEKPAFPLSANPAPRYPDVLSRAGVEGRVVVQVVVDTLGLPDTTTVKIVSSDHALFEAAVRAALPRLRFLPAEAGGRKVKMWVVIPFQFEIKR